MFGDKPQTQQQQYCPILATCIQQAQASGAPTHIGILRGFSMCCLFNLGVCGSSQQRQQQLQALLAAYPNTLQARTDSSHAAAAAQQQQQEVLAPQEFPAESPELVLYK